MEAETMNESRLMDLVNAESGGAERKARAAMALAMHRALGGMAAGGDPAAAAQGLAMAVAQYVLECQCGMRYQELRED